MYQEERTFKERIHHDTTVETLLTDSDNYVLAVIFEDLGTRGHETIGVHIWGVKCMNIDTPALDLFPEGTHSP